VNQHGHAAEPSAPPAAGRRTTAEPSASAAARGRVAAIVPVGGQSALLTGCLQALQRQSRPLDEIIVVDDTPRSTLPPVPGVRMLRSGGKGPYAARNAGWRATTAEVILFLDVRSRPKPDWASRLHAMFEDPAVAIAGSDIHIRGGRSLGARAGERHQFFSLEKYAEDGFFKPYFPTCNLAVRRDDLVRAGGFSEIRSGADADLCWRILSDPQRRLASIPDVLLEWVPRDRLASYLEQNFRYGRSNYALRAAWRGRGAPPRDVMPWSRLARHSVGTAVRAALARLRNQDEKLLIEVRRGGRMAYELGFRRAAWRDSADTTVSGASAADSQSP
jgi:cellulose synthase/poly-beta-1,6-N-acetylglucosamine synthase-like glycosyltransferase